MFAKWGGMRDEGKQSRRDEGRQSREERRWRKEKRDNRSN